MFAKINNITEARDMFTQMHMHYIWLLLKFITQKLPLDNQIGGL